MPGGKMTAMIADTFRSLHGGDVAGKVLTTLVVLLIIQGVFSFFRIYIFSYVTENAMKSLRNDTFSTIIRMPMQFFNERRVGDLSSRISSDITTIQETLNMTMAEFIRQIIIIVVATGYLISFSKTLTLVMFVTLPVIIIIMVWFGKFIRKLGKQTQDKDFLEFTDTIVEPNLCRVGLQSRQRMTRRARMRLRRLWPWPQRLQPPPMSSAGPLCRYTRSWGWMLCVLY